MGGNTHAGRKRWLKKQIDPGREVPEQAKKERENLPAGRKNKEVFSNTTVMGGAAGGGR